MIGYERLPCPADLTTCAVDCALGLLGFDNPILVVHPEEYGRAKEIAARYAIGVKSDPSLAYIHEWYLEWQGRRVGSEGA